MAGFSLRAAMRLAANQTSYRSIWPPLRGQRYKAPRLGPHISPAQWTLWRLALYNMTCVKLFVGVGIDANFTTAKGRADVCEVCSIDWHFLLSQTLSSSLRQMLCPQILLFRTRFPKQGCSRAAESFSIVTIVGYMAQITLLHKSTTRANCSYCAKSDVFDRCRRFEITRSFSGYFGLEAGEKEAFCPSLISNYLFKLNGGGDKLSDLGKNKRK